jgi:hypothetical protein
MIAMSNHFSCVGFHLPSANALGKLVKEALEHSETTWESGGEVPIQYERWSIGLGVELWMAGEGDRVTSIAPHFSGNATMPVRIVSVTIGEDFDGSVVVVREGHSLRVDVPDIAAATFREGEECRMQCCVFAHASSVLQEVAPSSPESAPTSSPSLPPASPPPESMPSSRGATVRSTFVLTEVEPSQVTVEGALVRVRSVVNRHTGREFLHWVIGSEGEGGQSIDVVLARDVGEDRPSRTTKGAKVGKAPAAQKEATQEPVVGARVRVSGWLSGRRAQAPSAAGSQANLGAN